MRRIIKSLFFLLVCSCLAACTDTAIVDDYESILRQRWSYDKPVKIEVEITDISKAYNVYINLRHTEDYAYSNIWLKTSVLGADKKKQDQRTEFTLAKPDGTWLGRGSGSLYSYRLILKENYRFSKAGKYVFVIEQNMRDNPLDAITDVGLRVEPAE